MRGIQGFGAFQGGSGIFSQVAIEASLAFFLFSFFFFIYYLTCETTGMTGWDGENLNILGGIGSSLLPFPSASFPVGCFLGGLSFRGWTSLEVRRLV